MPFSSIRRDVNKATARTFAKKNVKRRHKKHVTGSHLRRLPEWTDPKSYITRDGRHRLKGKDYERLRGEAYIRSAGKCEGGCGRWAIKGYLPTHPCAGEMAHNEHGAKKSDELHRVAWKNWLCHRYEHDTGRKECAPKGVRQ